MNTHYGHLGLCLGLLCQSAWALPTVYNDSIPDGTAAFSTSVTTAGGTVKTDPLGGLAYGNSWNRADFTITSTDGSDRNIDPSYQGLTGQAIGISPYNPAANSGLTFTFKNPINAFGLEIGDWATCCYLPSSLYISFDGGATLTVAQASSRNDNPGYVKTGQFANFVSAVDDTKTFKTVTFYGDGFGEYLVAGGTIYYALVPIGSFTAALNQPGLHLLTSNGLRATKLASIGFFNRMDGLLRGGLDRQTAKPPALGEQLTANLDSLVGLANVLGNGGDRYQRFLSDVTAWQTDSLGRQLGTLAPGAGGFGATESNSSYDLFRVGEWRGSLAVRYHLGEHDAVGNANAYEYSGYSATFGLDTNLGKKGLIGVGVAYGGESSDTTDTPDRTSVDSTAWSMLLYGSYALNDWAYVDGVASHGWTRHDITRLNIGNRLTASPDGRETLVAIRGGASFQRDDVRFGPFGGLQYAETEIDAYRETGLGALSVDSQHARSLIAQVGYQVSTTWIDEDKLRITPQARLSFEHEFEESGRLVNVGPVVGVMSPLRVDSNDAGWYTRLDLGFGVNFSSVRSLRLDYEILGNSDFMEQALTARFRMQF